MSGWQTILARIRDRRIVGIEYDDETGYLRLLLDDGSVLYVAACYEEDYHVALDIPGRR
ncbi:MAG: hypothetical protein GTO22_01200 [Gemmatimonadales bacterium]|nr:hypothetical protein [Gemmatimonadales bacterium]